MNWSALLNRKWLVPLCTAIVEIIMMVAAAVFGYENLPFTPAQLGEILATAFLAIFGVVSGGDVIYDLLGRILEIVLALRDTQPTASTSNAPAVYTSRPMPSKPEVG